MLLFAAAAIASALPQDAAAARPIVQARATVRIVAGARIQFDQKANAANIPPAKSTVVQTSQGPQRATLVEFE